MTLQWARDTPARAVSGGLRLGHNVGMGTGAPGDARLEDETAVPDDVQIPADAEEQDETVDAAADDAADDEALGESDDDTTTTDEPAPDEPADDLAPAPARRPRDVEATLSLIPLVWQRAADAVLVRSRPQFGEHVLDVGTGAAAVSAAELAGPDGRVDAVLRDASIAQAARDAAGEPLRQLVLHRQGLEAWSFGDYDLVQLALALDPVDDDELERTARDLVRRVRPGGRIAVAVWTGRAFAELVPALVAAAGPHDRRLAHADPAELGPTVRHAGPVGSFAQRLVDYGLVDVRADELPRRVPLDAALAWSLVVGTELVHLLDGVDGDVLPAVREGFLAELERGSVEEVDLSMFVATGTLPEPA